MVAGRVVCRTGCGVRGASWREWASVLGFSLLSFSLLFFSSIFLAKLAFELESTSVQSLVPLTHNRLFGRIELLSDQYREWVLTKYLKISGLPSSSPYGCWLRKMPSRVGLEILLLLLEREAEGR